MVVEVVRLRQMSLTEILELPEERSLLAVIEGPGDGLGLVALCPQILSAFIEVLTTGRISRGDPAPRKPTRTDAAMAAGLIDSVLAELEIAMEGGDDLCWAGGYRYASFLADMRPIGLILEDQAYRVLVAKLTLGGGARQGEVILALPAQPHIKPRSKGGPKDGVHGVPAPSAETEDWQDAMERAVMTAEADLCAVLHRMTLPLSAVMSFEPGLLVPLPLAALDQVAVEGPGGRRLAEGRLGQNRGNRALRLTFADADPTQLPALVPPSTATRSMPSASVAASENRKSA
jgi:flagellar motor switch protein FliM